MVNTIINTISDKDLGYLLEISSDAGKNILLAVMKEELKVTDDLMMGYDSPELRTIHGKIVKNREVSKEERQLYEESKITFIGKSKKGHVFSEASVLYLKTVIELFPSFQRNIAILDNFLVGEDRVEGVFLGVNIYRLRSNAIFFSKFVKENLHLYPEEVTSFLKDLIDEIIDSKIKESKITFRLSEEEVFPYLLPVGVSHNEIVEMINKSAGVAILEKEVSKTRSIFVKLLAKASEIDLFMMENDELMSNIRLLHNKFSIFFLHYFLNFLKEPVKNKIRINFPTLLTFYRKGVELCGSV